LIHKKKLYAYKNSHALKKMSPHAKKPQQKKSKSKEMGVMAVRFYNVGTLPHYKLLTADKWKILITIYR